MSKGILAAVDFVAIIACGFGGALVLIALLDTGASAPQQAAMAAVGIGLGAIPYMIGATLHRRFIRDRQP